MGFHLKRENRQRVQGARWRRLDNTGKLFAAVSGEDLSNVFRLTVVLKEEVQQELLNRALLLTLEEYENFRVKLRKGFFWYYFESNNRKPLAEREEGVPCRFIDPHGSSRFPFRVSFYGTRIHFEVFHGLTDGLGALDFVKALTENYLDLISEEKETAKAEAAEGKGNGAVQEKKPAPEKEPGKAAADGYLKNYKKRPARHYSTKKALSIRGACLPLNMQAVIHGTVPLSQLKAICRRYQVSITKYLAAALLWSLLRIYTDGKKLKYPAAINLPVNLRAFFETETIANFFAITNLFWPAGRLPESFEEVLKLVSVQMDDQIVKERLEALISYNVSNEKKWYVRIIPLFIKQRALDLIYRRSTRAYTMTLSNLGLIRLGPEYTGMVEEFRVLIGVSRRQRIKCGVIAYGENVSITFTSVMADSRLPDYFFGFLEKQGMTVRGESNGVSRPDLDAGGYPPPEYDKGKLKRFSGVLYLVLFTAAALTGVVNAATYRLVGTWWSLLTIGAAAYVIMILRYSIMRRASLAGHLVRHSLGIQMLLIIFDGLNGFGGWSVNYVIPSLIIFDVIAIVFLILVNRMNWQSYFMYQLALTMFSFIPLLLWVFGLMTRPFLSMVAVILSVSVLVVTMLLGDRSVKNELKRRFHL